MEKKHKHDPSTPEKLSTTDRCSDDPADDSRQIDDIIGGFGKYQFMIFMFKILIGATSAFNNLGVTFFAPADFISFWCADVGATPIASHSSQSFAPILSSNISQAGFNSSLVHNSVPGPFADTQRSILREDSLSIRPIGFGDGSIGIRHLLGDFVTNGERTLKHSLNMNSDTPKNLRKECKYKSSTDDQYHKCTAYNYDTGIWISTIIDEWDLVCDRAWFVSVSQSLYMAGFIVSYLIFGYISDRFGRWNSLLLGALIEISSGFGCAFASSVTQFMIYRFLLGLGNAGRSSSSYLIMIEWTGVKWRVHISTLGSLGWVLGYCFMPWIVLFFLHFRHMQLFVCFYEMIFVIWLLRLPESPRWLLTHRRFREAREVLLMAAKFNGLITKSSDNSVCDNNNLTEGYISADDGYSNWQGGTVPSLDHRNQGLLVDSVKTHERTFGDFKRTSDASGGCEIKQFESSLPDPFANGAAAQAGANGAVPQAKPTANGSHLNGTSGESDAKWCRDDASSLAPYSEDEFDLKFKRLTNMIEAKEFTKNEDKLSILDLFKWKNLRKYALILAFAWACNSFIYYGIALRVGDYGSKNLFVAFTFAGATEIPSIAFTIVCMKMLPRRTTNIFLFSTILTLCIIQVPLRYFDCQWLQQITMMLAKLFNSCSFTCILYQTMELFPTSIRQTAYSSCSLAGRIGSILAPFIKELSQTTNALVPPIIYAALSILEILLIRHLPETQGSDLPDTLLEAENFKGTNKAPKEESKYEIAENGGFKELK